MTVAGEMEAKWPLSPDNWKTDPRFLYTVTFRCPTKTVDSKKLFQFVIQESIWSTRMEYGDKTFKK